MFNIVETDKTTIYAIGNIHGEFKAIGNWIKSNDLRDCALIFYGDFGLGFDGLQKEHDDLTRDQRACEERNVDCYIIRGNHDNPEYYNNTSKSLNLSRFKPLSDYTVIKSPEHNILCLGGAVSTDRTYRKQSYENEITELMAQRHMTYEKAKSKVKCYWWEDEKFVLDLESIEAINNSEIKINAICSHSAPTEAYPLLNQRTLYWMNQDDNLEGDMKDERNNFSSVLKLLKDNDHPVTNWYYGHFHEHNTETIDGTTFNLLDMGRNGRMNGGMGGNFDMKEIH